MKKSWHFGRKPRMENIGFGIRVLLFGFATVFLGLFLGFYLDAANKKQNWIETEALIFKIEVYRNGDDANHYVHVSYLIDGVSYNSQLGYYSSSFDVGDNIVIYVDPDNYSNVSYPLKAVYFSFLGISSVFFLSALITYFVVLTQRNNQEKMLNSSNYIRVKFVKVEEKRNVSINGYHPFVLVYQGELKGETKIFKSKHFWDNPEDCIDEFSDELRVYYNPDKPKKYFLDTRRIEERQKRQQEKEKEAKKK